MEKFENINLDREMYSQGNLSDILEQLDPSENYIGTPLEGLDAFGRQLKRFDIKVSGPNSDTVEKFFQTGNSSILFPEFVRRCVLLGKDAHDVLPEIVATTTQLSGFDYRSIGASFCGDNFKISTKESLCHVHRRGKTIAASYESLRFQRLDLFSITLKRIGEYISNSQFVDAVMTILDGDGNNNPAAVIPCTNPSLYGWLCTAYDFGGFDTTTATTIIASPNVAKQIVYDPEFRDRIAFGYAGVYYLPFNIHMIVSHVVPDNCVVFLDKSAALEMVKVGGVEVDYIKLIERKFECAAVRCSAGFSKIYDSAMRVLKYEE